MMNKMVNDWTDSDSKLGVKKSFDSTLSLPGAEKRTSFGWLWYQNGDYAWTDEIKGPPRTFVARTHSQAVHVHT